MSEARAVTNFSGNAVATLLVASWTNTLDREQLDRTLSGEDPFDEATMIDLDDHETVAESAPVAVEAGGPDAAPRVPAKV
jgi:aerobic C4-dicarboxylate transport protein